MVELSRSMEYEYGHLDAEAFIIGIPPNMLIKVNFYITFRTIFFKYFFGIKKIVSSIYIKTTSLVIKLSLSYRRIYKLGMNDVLKF